MVRCSKCEEEIYPGATAVQMSVGEWDQDYKGWETIGKTRYFCTPMCLSAWLRM